MQRIPFVAVLLVASLPAQKAIPADAFLPPDYRTIVAVDLVALRDRGIWDELEGSLLAVALRGLEREAGFPLECLDRLRASVFMPPDWQGDSPPPQIMVLEGRERLDLPESVRNNDSWQETEVAGHPVWTRRHGRREDLIVTLPPHVRVEGCRSLIEPVLLGRHGRSQPAPDVMSLLSGRGDNLAYMVFDVGSTKVQHPLVEQVFPGIEWPAEDAPTFVMLRLRARGTADDPQLELEGVVRHQKGEAGLEASEAAVQRWLEGLAQHPQYGAVKHVWRRIALLRDGTDLVARLPLGRARDSVGTLAILFAPLFQRPQTVQARPAEPAPAPKQPDKDPR